MAYHLELLEQDKGNQNLNVFSRAHMSYINQIFGDQTVRQIIQDIMQKPGSLVVVNNGTEATHHVFQTANYKKICSIDLGYQDLTADPNDTLCQSYSLMTYLQIPFDHTPSDVATETQKFQKQMAMINMYRKLLRNKAFVDAFTYEIVFEENNQLWLDTVNHKKPFHMIEKFKKAAPIIKNIKRVLDIWEDYGWKYFIGSK
jgi:hypothetical protein